MTRDGKVTGSYSTRSNAHRAARQACRVALDAPRYEAFEGPDYGIHPRFDWHSLDYRFGYSLRGPALEADEERK